MSTHMNLTMFDCVIILFLVLCSCVPSAHPLFFNLTSFHSDTKNIAYQSDDFTTRFSFTISNTNGTTYSDGFAFYLAPVGYPLLPNSTGPYLGIFNTPSNTTTTTDDSKYPCVAVEFDSFLDDFDPPIRHVGINNNSIVSSAYTWFDIDRNIGKPGRAKITYEALTNTLSVFWSFDPNTSPDTFMPNSSLSYQIDLSKTLPPSVTVGFSAATGVFPARHTIHSWEFSSSYNSMYWDSMDTNKKDQSTHNKVVVVVAVVASAISSLVFVVTTASICWFIIRKRSRGFHHRCIIAPSLVESDLDKSAIPRRFNYQELVQGTNGFADDRKLGRGGSGQVYKGVLNDLGRTVAIKRIFADFENSEKIFINEVKIISRLIHRNLVQFIGWCHEQGEFLLVFEYMPNGSLDAHLYGNRRTLAWNVRYKIALGVATAIHYLHEDAEQCVLHRDIKSANVLVDTDFITKLGDFGMAKLVDPRLRTERTGVVGTYGYLAPEYINGGRASKESDMYSFGVVALEIACGRRTYEDGEYHVPLVNWVWQKYVEGNVIGAADEKLEGDFDENEMMCLLTVGLWCTHPMDKERPKAAQVIRALQLEVTLPSLPHHMHNFTPPSTTPHSHSFQTQPITTSLAHIGR
ncbi:L-type lectin-domain containing receptor kinase IX.1-like [Senna tora]|uniref:non-specific serine/threonine protein kinase n=1 Tax=Senna tora TaxID=362788 RepID=A0A834TX72_9FABA|nr:L-type lectin-domain containing receptor kinase IX.1-like [Senna tora]